jgi:hypothetical protein
MPKLNLRESEIAIIHQAAASLPRSTQTLFLRCVSDQLLQEAEIGDGTVARVVRIAQKTVLGSAVRNLAPGERQLSRRRLD